MSFNIQINVIIIITVVIIGMYIAPETIYICIIL